MEITSTVGRIPTNGVIRTVQTMLNNMVPSSEIITEIGTKIIALERSRNMTRIVTTTYPFKICTEKVPNVFIPTSYRIIVSKGQTK